MNNWNRNFLRMRKAKLGTPFFCRRSEGVAGFHCLKQQWLVLSKQRSMIGLTATSRCSARTRREMCISGFLFTLRMKLKRPYRTLQVKKAAAETEKAWAGAGQKVGLQMWRIVKFKVIYKARQHCNNRVHTAKLVVLRTNAGDPLAEESPWQVFQRRLVH